MASSPLPPPLVADGEITNNNVLALHKNSISVYLQARDHLKHEGADSSDDEDDMETTEDFLGSGDLDHSTGAAEDDVESSAKGVIKRHVRFPDLTNVDVQNMSLFFGIDTNPNSQANLEQYFGEGGGIDDGSSLESRYISGPAFVGTVTHRLKSMIRQHSESGTEMTFVRQLYDEFPNLYRPKSEDYMQWIKYFLDWISILNHTPNLTELLATPRITVIHSASEAFKKLLKRQRRRQLHGGGADDGDDEARDDDYGSANEDTYDVLGVSVEDVYPAFKKSATIDAVLAIIEILDERRGISMDRALDKVRLKLEKSSGRLFATETTDIVNMHLHNYDLIDMDDTVQFLDEVTQLAINSNVVFPAPFCTLTHITRENRQFFKFDLIKLFNNFNVAPKDFYSIHFTSITNYTTVHALMKSHALTSTSALAILQDMTRIRYSHRMNPYESDLVMLRRMLDVIRTGVYPFASNTSLANESPSAVAAVASPALGSVGGVSRTMSVKKRYTCLLLAHTFLELRFNAFLHYGYFDITENAFVWHSLFHRLPNLFELLCGEIARGNADLSLVPMYLLRDLDDKCNAYLSDFKQYTFTSLDSADSMLYPEVAKPAVMATLYVDILTRYGLIDINSGDVINNYYERVMSRARIANPYVDRALSLSDVSSKFDYDPVTEYARPDRKARRKERLELTSDNRNVSIADKFRDLNWTPMFPMVLRNRLVPGTCCRRIRGIEIFNSSNSGGGDGTDVRASMVSDADVAWSRSNHETSGVEFTCMFMTREQKVLYDEQLRAFKMRHTFRIPPGGCTGNVEVNKCCANWDTSSSSSGGGGGNGHKSGGDVVGMLGDRIAEYANIVLQGTHDNDIITNTLTGYAGPDGMLVSGIAADNYGNRIGYPGGVDLQREPGFDMMRYLDGYMNTIEVMQFDDSDEMSDNIIKIAVKNAITAERKRMLSNNAGQEPMVVDNDAAAAANEAAELKSVISHYGYANKHQIMTIEAIFRYLYVHKRSLDLLKFGVSQGIHPISMLHMCSTRDDNFSLSEDSIVHDPTATSGAMPGVSAYFSKGCDKSTNWKTTVDARRLLTGWLRRTNTLSKAEIYADITQSFMAVFQIGAEALKYQMNLANCSIIDFITYVFNFAITTFLARKGGGGGTVEEQQQVLLERRSEQLQRRRQQQRNQQMTVGDALEAVADSVALFDDDASAGSWADEPRPLIMMRFTAMFNERMNAYYNSHVDVRDQRVYYNDRTFFNDHIEMDLMASNYMNVLRAQLDAVNSRNKRYMEKGTHPNQRRDVVAEVLDNMPFNKLSSTHEIVDGHEWSVSIGILHHVSAYIVKNANNTNSYAVYFYGPPSTALLTNRHHFDTTTTAATGQQQHQRGPPVLNLGHVDRNIDMSKDICAIGSSDIMNWNQSEIDYAFDLLEEVIPQYLFESQDTKKRHQLYVINTATKEVEVNLYKDMSNVEIFKEAMLRYNMSAHIANNLRIKKSRLLARLARADNETDKGVLREKIGEIDESLENYSRFASYGIASGSRGNKRLDASNTAPSIADILNDVTVDTNGHYHLMNIGVQLESPMSQQFPVIKRHRTSPDTATIKRSRLGFSPTASAVEAGR